MFLSNEILNGIRISLQSESKYWQKHQRHSRPQPMSTPKQTQARLSCPSFFFGRNSRKFERSSAAAAALDLHSQIGMNSQVSKQRCDFDSTLQKATGTRSPEPHILKNAT